MTGRRHRCPWLLLVDRGKVEDLISRGCSSFAGVRGVVFNQRRFEELWLEVLSRFVSESVSL
jgi:hypothetical protein